MLSKYFAVVIVLILYGCVGSTIPPIPHSPFTGGSTARVNFEIAKVPEKSTTDSSTGGLFPLKGRIFNVTLHLYQYEGCRKMLRGTVVLKPSRPVHSMALRGDDLLFVNVRFHGSKGWGRSDIVLQLQQKAEYTVSTIYEPHTPDRFKMAAYQNLSENGKPTMVPVEALTYREGLLSAMLNCRDKDKEGPDF